MLLWGPSFQTIRQNAEPAEPLGPFFRALGMSGEGLRMSGGGATEPPLPLTPTLAALLSACPAGPPALHGHSQPPPTNSSLPSLSRDHPSPTWQISFWQQCRRFCHQNTKCAPVFLPQPSGVGVFRKEALGSNRPVFPRPRFAVCKVGVMVLPPGKDQACESSGLNASPKRACPFVHVL